MKQFRLFSCSIFCLSLLISCRTTESFQLSLWNVTTYGEARVIPVEKDTILYTEIVSKGNSLQDILVQYNSKFVLETGYKYRLRFDAWSTKSGIIQVYIGKNIADDSRQNLDMTSIKL